MPRVACSGCLRCYVNGSEWCSSIVCMALPSHHPGLRTDGKLPEEVARPRPIHYVCYALTAFLRTARLASFVGVDVWSHLAMTEVRGRFQLVAGFIRLLATYSMLIQTNYTACIAPVFFFPYGFYWMVCGP
jgi:hypothetical protein